MEVELLKTVVGVAIPQMGVASIFLWIWWKERENRINETNKKDAVSESVSQAFIKNMEIMTEVKANLRENTEVTKKTLESTSTLASTTNTLVTTIDYLLRNGIPKNT